MHLPSTASLQAFLSGFQQGTRLLQLSTPLGRDKLLAECVRGEEGMGEGFSFCISALSTDAGISLKSLIGQPALLQLLTAQRGDLRPFHGHIVAVEQSGANGGFARYQLTLQPWTSFLALGRDSRVFQDMNVFDILDAVFGGYQGMGKLIPAWRFDIAERAIYPLRSLTTQYQESNLAFAERLMAEEGLFHFFEHEGDPDSASLGSHTLVIADHNGSFVPNRQAQIAFTQSGAVMKQDGLDRWRTQVQLRTNAVELSSWDYRSRSSRPVSAAAGEGGVQLVCREPLGAYAYETREQGQRMAERQLQALVARQEVHTAAGTVRTLAPGTTFTLHGQAQLDAAGGDDARTFVVVRTVHLMHNNLSAELKADVASHLRDAALALLIGKECASSLHAVGTQAGERPLYRTRIDAIRSNVPYRTSQLDQHGGVRHQRPTVSGQQTAIVVGPAGSVIHTDRDHRIKVQFHWQRGARSHSRLAHPDPDSHSGAPADDTAGTWVRVACPMAPLAGANWGSHAVPRVGQEVLIDFLDGDIDRPVAIGAVHNGKGAKDHQHNEFSRGAGASTGNAPPWFPGESGAHAHPAVLSGFKSQAMAASQSGAGGYSQMVFDDSPGQARMALQQHARPHQGAAELNLGQLRHQTDNQRLLPAGFGAELKTEHGAALRAGQGMLLSSDERSGAAGSQLDAREASAQIGQSAQLQTDWATTAQKHNAKLKDRAGNTEPAPDKLPAIAQMKASAAVIDTLASGDAAGADTGGKVAAYSAQQLQLSAPAGIAAATPANALLRSGASSSIAAGQDINFASQGNHFHAVMAGISLFTYGKASAADKPNQETGLKLHAGTGKLSSQSQSDQTSITADKLVTVASIAKSVGIAAKEHVMLTAMGAVLKLEGGNIMLHGPGKMTFKASMKELSGPANGSFGAPALPAAKPLYDEQFVVRDEHSGVPMAHVPYRIVTEDGQHLTGVTNEAGQTERIHSASAKNLKFFFE